MQWITKMEWIRGHVISFEFVIPFLVNKNMKLSWTHLVIDIIFVVLSKLMAMIAEKQWNTHS